MKVKDTGVGISENDYVQVAINGQEGIEMALAGAESECKNWDKGCLKAWSFEQQQNCTSCIGAHLGSCPRTMPLAISTPEVSSPIPF